MLVLAAARNAVPGCVVKAAAQNNLVCDGRLVVDAAFRTNDPKIFAAGTIAKFSRRSVMQAICHIHLMFCEDFCLLQFLAWYINPCQGCRVFQLI